MKKKPQPTAYALETIELVESKQLKLTTFTPADEMPEGEPWDSIRYLYSRPQLNYRAMACLMNGVASTKKKSFLLSRNLLEEYLVSDSNVDRTSMNGTENRAVMDKLLATMNGASFLRCLSPHHRAKAGSKGVAGTFAIVDPKFIAMLNWWNDEPSPMPTPISTGIPTTEYESECEYVREHEYVSESEEF